MSHGDLDQLEVDDDDDSHDNNGGPRGVRGSPGPLLSHRDWHHHRLKVGPKLVSHSESRPSRSGRGASA